jgi:streptogramin lyase
MTRTILSSVLATMALVSGCDGGAPSSSPTSCPSTDALWASSDYSSSAVGALSLSGALVSSTGHPDLGLDPALASSRGRAFFVARDLDLVFELDPRCGTPRKQYSAHVASPRGPNSDPYDVGVAHDGSLWIPLYLAAKVLVLPADGSAARTIDLSPYDGDGNPEAMGIAMVDTPAGEKAFVPLQRLNPYPKSTQPSWMLRIDVATARVEAQVVLAGRNPFGLTADGSGALWLAEPGNYDLADEPLAGVERFDTAASTSALVVHEVDLGGSVSEVSVSAGCGAAIVADATSANATALVTFDPASGAVRLDASHSPLSTAGAGGGFFLEGLTWLNGSLLIGDRRRAADGYPVHRLAADACTLTAQPDSIFLPLPAVAVRPVN